MASWDDKQQKFPFMGDSDCDAALQKFGSLVAEQIADKVTSPLRDMIRSELDATVERAVKKSLTSKGVHFVEEELKDLFAQTIHEYFRPIRDDFQRIADSYRREDDSSDWWKNGADKDDE